MLAGTCNAAHHVIKLGQNGVSIGRCGQIERVLVGQGTTSKTPVMHYNPSKSVLGFHPLKQTVQKF